METRNCTGSRCSLYGIRLHNWALSVSYFFYCNANFLYRIAQINEGR